jgi:hypothetical protein
VLVIALALRDDQVERLPDRLFGAVAVELLRAAVPGHEDAVQRAGRDRVVGGVENRHEVLAHRIGGTDGHGSFGARIERARSAGCGVGSRLGCLWRGEWVDAGPGSDPVSRATVGIGSTRVSD